MTNIEPTQIVRRAMQRMLERIDDAEQELGRLDAAAGDGDHGAGMMRGLHAANDAIAECGDDAPAGEMLVEAGSAFADEAGGASGALVGALISTIGQNLHSELCTSNGVHRALAAGLQMVCTLGKAQPGDKTLVDTLDPFVRAFGEAAAEGHFLAEAWQRALPAAEAGAHSTAGMVSKRGRSSRLGERSRGHLDPGAMSMLYMLQAAGGALQTSES